MTKGALNEDYRTVEKRNEFFAYQSADFTAENIEPLNHFFI